MPSLLTAEKGSNTTPVSLSTVPPAAMRAVEETRGLQRVGMAIAKRGVRHANESVRACVDAAPTPASDDTQPLPNIH